MKPINRTIVGIPPRRRLTATDTQKQIKLKVIYIYDNHRHRSYINFIDQFMVCNFSTVPIYFVAIEQI